jgi:outer membrane lipoprotein-sorting protein
MIGRPPFLALLLMLALSGAPHAACAQTPGTGWGLAQLMAGMQQVRSATARFVERKQVQLLNQPLQSSGKLIYVAPDQLDKQTLTPNPSRLTVSGDRLTIEQQDGTTRQIALSEHPEIGALVDSIRATLAGDLANLTHIYTVALTGGVQDWSLSLQPRDPRLRDIVTIIRIQGEANRVRSIETVESGGDRSVMTIIPDPR